MEKKAFEKLIKNKTADELHKLLNRYVNGLTNLTTIQANKCISLKNKLEKGGRKSGIIRKNMETKSTRRKKEK